MRASEKEDTFFMDRPGHSSRYSKYRCDVWHAEHKYRTLRFLKSNCHGLCPTDNESVNELSRRSARHMWQRLRVCPPRGCRHLSHPLFFYHPRHVLLSFTFPFIRKPSNSHCRKPKVFKLFSYTMSKKKENPKMFEVKFKCAEKPFRWTIRIT